VKLDVHFYNVFLVGLFHHVVLTSDAIITDARLIGLYFLQLTIYEQLATSAVKCETQQLPLESRTSKREPRIVRMPFLEEGGMPLGLVDDLDERQL
jgi:hypothetical protein